MASSSVVIYTPLSCRHCETVAAFRQLLHMKVVAFNKNKKQCRASVNHVRYLLHMKAVASTKNKKQCRAFVNHLRDSIIFSFKCINKLKPELNYCLNVFYKSNASKCI